MKAFKIISLLSLFLFCISITAEAQTCRRMKYRAAYYHHFKVYNSSTYLPDLEVSHIRIVPQRKEPHQYYQGKIIVPVEIEIRNNGFKAISTYHSFYATLKVGNYTNTFEVTGGMFAKESITLRYYLELPENSIGNYFTVNAFVDKYNSHGQVYLGTVKEYDERNNTYTKRLQLSNEYYALGSAY